MRVPPPVSPSVGFLPWEELKDRLCINSPLIVEDLQTIMRGLLQQEDGRRSRLDSKAQGLLGAASLTLTVSLALGGLILQRGQSFASELLAVLASIYVLALFCGLGASIQAVRALFVRGEYKNVSLKVALDPETLALANQEAESRPTDDFAIRDRRAQTFYRRFMIAHLNDIYEAHFHAHRKLAKLVWLGQLLFMAFLASLLALGIVIAASAVCF